MPSTIYRTVLSSAQDRMSTAITQIRDSLPHPGEIGGLVERVFRARLEEILPEKVGVSNGFVVDSEGGVSRQMDIILFDRQNTPRIFTSEGAQMFPVESTYACGEVKTNLDGAELRDVYKKCLSYKRLQRSAYYPPTGNSVYKFGYELFGCENEHWQSIFFCVAASSVSSCNLMTAYKTIVEGASLQIHERVDTIMALHATNGQNMLLNGIVDEGGVPQDQSINFLPYPGSSICTYQANEPWSLFVMLLLHYMNQVPTEPLSMLRYGGSEPF